MNTASPPKNTPTKLSLPKNVRLNLNTKFIPQDFFPKSISQSSKTRKLSNKQSVFMSTPQSPSTHQTNNIQDYATEQLKNIELLKERLIKLKSFTQEQSQTNKKFSLKKTFLQKKSEKSIIGEEKKSQIKENRENKSKKYSRKMMDYMQKMKNAINIDIKLVENVATSSYYQHPLQFIKLASDEVQTDDSPKIQRFRPKSEFSNRQSVTTKQKGKDETVKKMMRPFKMRSKQLRKMAKIEDKEEIIRSVCRRDKCGDLQLNDEGMLTFYGSFNQNLQGQGSRRYGGPRPSLPRLDK